MCLIVSENAKELTAKKDIVCFKFFIKSDERNRTVYRSAYMQVKYKLNETVRLRKKLIVYTSKFSEKPRKYINEGLHSYTEAGANATNLKMRLFKCIIPKGAKYYEGYHNDKSFTGYVSTSLKVIGPTKSYS